jgi:hypothetical protein
MDNLRIEREEPDGGDLTSESTTELVRELMDHGQSLVEKEARLFAKEVGREFGRAREDFKADGQTAVHEARERLQQGIAMLREDLRDQQRRLTATAKPMAIGGVLVHAGMYLFLFAFVFLLSRWLPLWASALIVGLIVVGAGGLMLRSGMQKVEHIGEAALTRTNHQLTEIKQWIARTKRVLTTRMQSVKSSLKGIELPRLPLSSGDGHNRSTSGFKPVAP